LVEGFANISWYLSFLLGYQCRPLAQSCVEVSVYLSVCPLTSFHGVSIMKFLSIKHTYIYVLLATSGLEIESSVVPK
jgi:hypothetical protein